MMGNKIGRITTGGVITEFAIPTPNSAPQCIVAGPDGNLWFVEGDGNKIGRITTSGAITEFANSPGGWPQCLTVGPDGNIWFADQGPIGGGALSGNGSIGRITMSGVITKFSVPTPNSEPSFITTGPDGALWYTYGNDQNIGINKIGRITTAGVVSEFSIPTPSSAPGGIVSGPDGALWFTEVGASKIGRITTSGTITEYPLPAGTAPLLIVAGPDGALWFTETGVWMDGAFVGGGQKIGRITTSGVTSDFSIPTPTSRPLGIVVGPDSAIWFTEAEGNKIGRLLVQSAQTISFNAPPNLPLGSNSFIPSATATSGLAVSFSSLAPSVCLVTANMVTLVATGTCTIAADQPGNTSYAAAPQVSQSFLVTPALLAQTISFPALPNRVSGTAPFAISATASSGLTVSFTSLTSSTCSVSGTTVTILALGTCTVQASQAGNGTYAVATPVSQSFSITASVGGAAGDTGDVPLPAWALALLGSALLGGIAKRKRNLG
jgi:virginiamycin B lyase